MVMALVGPIIASSLLTPPITYGIYRAQQALSSSLKRKFPESVWTTPYSSKRPKVVSSRKRISMPRFKRRSFKRRFRRRRRSFKRGSRRRFTKAVRRVILRTAEPKSVISSEVIGFDAVQGDATSKVVYVNAPLNALIQGVQDDMYIGNKIWVKGISFRGQAGTSSEGDLFSGYLLRVTLLFSKEQNSEFAAGWNVYGNTTTRTTNPTATAPNVNPVLFSASTLTGQYTGQGWVQPFDHTKVKVIKSHTLQVNPGTVNLDANDDNPQVATPTPFKFFYPIRRWMQIEDPVEADLSGIVPRFKYGSYILVMQVIADTASVSASPCAEIDYRIEVFYRDP